MKEQFGNQNEQYLVLQACHPPQYAENISEQTFIVSVTYVKD